MPHPEIGTVLVTGGSSGLGAAVVDAVRLAGGTPVVLDRQPPAEGIHHQVVDLADTASAQAAVATVAGLHGGIDAVVAAAGTDACGTLADVSTESWENVIKVNLLGTAAVIRSALPFLLRCGEGGGKIVTVASTLGFRALSDASAYCASKFGVVGLTRALTAELKGQVGVTLLVPGGMATAFFDARDPQYQPPSDAKLNRPEDVAEAVMFALRQPPGCEVRELVIAPSMEGSWP